MTAASTHTTFQLSTVKFFVVSQDWWTNSASLSILFHHCIVGSLHFSSRNKEIKWRLLKFSNYKVA